MTDTDSQSPLHLYRQALDLTFEQFAKKFGVNKTTARYWERARVPAERVLEVSRVTGIPPHVLRPDIYPAPKRQPPS